MHLQRFVLSGLLIGAAWFLPTNAFAEKADLVPKQPVVKELTMKAAAVAQEQVKKSKEEISNAQAKMEREVPGKKEPVVSPSPQTGSVKPAQLIKTLPEQASSQAKTAVQAVEKTVKQTSKELLPEKAIANPGKKKGLLMKKEALPVRKKKPVQQGKASENIEPVKPALSEKPSSEPLQRPEPEEMTQKQASKAVKPSDNTRIQLASTAKAQSANQSEEEPASKTAATPVNEDKDKPASNVKGKLVHQTNAQPIISKKSNTQSPPVFAGLPKENHSSGTDKRVPHEKQATAPSQSNQHAGGSSKDRAKAGNSSVNYIDKWLDWGHYWTLEISQSHTSRIKEFSNQWTNAPPSQPPKLFLFS
ncbi:hypothetical protein [Pseudobacillus wudalianchiensis]|uniref:Uncharacterized protein n=1 Tax=Pseudobacillus wudalianchiensis TaxID=1743143 RepID=A0A1B9B740_9BACI|nr:hypothetical protein [Bacillus wudalianchiensis]OCA91883.1 hypothetical protein A8F95_19355 [Bacillus wudalianchiensis]